MAETQPQPWSSGTDVPFGPDVAYSNATVCLSTNAGWLDTFAPLVVTGTGDGGFPIAPMTAWPSFYLNTTRLYAEIPITAWLSPTDSASMSTYLRLSFDGNCSGDAPGALGTAWEPWAGPGLLAVDFNPGLGGAAQGLYVCMSTNVGSPDGNAWARVNMSLPFAGDAETFGVAEAVRYNISNNFARRTVFVELTEPVRPAPRGFWGGGVRGWWLGGGGGGGGCAS